MVDWSEETDEAYNDYFRKVSTPRLVHHITNGRISPWLLYTCDSAMEALARLNEQEVTIVWPFIDSDVWQRKLRDYPGDAEIARHVLSEAGI